MLTRLLVIVLALAAGASAFASAFAGAKPAVVPQSRAAMYRERLIPIGSNEYGMKSAAVALQTSTAKKQMRRILAMPNIHIEEQKGELVGHEPRTGVTRTLGTHGFATTTVALPSGNEFETLRMPIDGHLRIRTEGEVHARVNRTVQAAAVGRAMRLRLGETLEMPKRGDHVRTFDYGNGEKHFEVTRQADGATQNVLYHVQHSK